MITHNLDNDLLGAIKEADLGKMTQILEWGANPDAADMLGDTAMIWAVRVPHLFADPADETDVAAKKEFSLAAMRLLKEHGANIDKPNNLGRSPIFQAVIDKNREAVVELAGWKASMLLIDSAGNGLPRYAELCGAQDIAKFISETTAKQAEEKQQQAETAAARQTRQQSLRNFVRTRKM